MLSEEWVDFAMVMSLPAPLTLTERKVLYLYAIRGLSHREINEVLGLRSSHEMASRAYAHARRYVDRELCH